MDIYSLINRSISNLIHSFSYFYSRVLAIFLLSLAGIPLTGGFFAKYYMLASVMKTGHYIVLAIIAVLFAAVSVYYYFRLIQAMYFKEGTPELHSSVTSTDKFLLGLTCVLIILLGVAPQLFLSHI